VNELTPAPIKPTVSVADIEKLDVGFADGITPVLAVPERAVPNGARAG
jgi:hypothetical protein